MIIVSGLSGAGKTTALHALEDLGYYCIDNLPGSLLQTISDSEMDSNQSVVIGIDIRSHLDGVDIDQLKKKSKTKIIFLTADDDVLIKRFSESRRKHPLLDKKETLVESIEKEKQFLRPLQEGADHMIDTGDLSVYDLANQLAKLLQFKEVTHTVITLESFGFKYGAPTSADLVFDVRFLPNPYWEKDLKQFNGTDQQIADYLSSYAQTKDFISETSDYLLRWFPHYLKNKRSYLTIAIGCTGGQHRSVYVTEQIAKKLKEAFQINIRHKHLKVS